MLPRTRPALSDQTIRGMTRNEQPIPARKAISAGVMTRQPGEIGHGGLAGYPSLHFFLGGEPSSWYLGNNAVFFTNCRINK